MTQNDEIGLTHSLASLLSYTSFARGMVHALDKSPWVAIDSRPSKTTLSTEAPALRLGRYACYVPHDISGRNKHHCVDRCCDFTTGDSGTPSAMDVFLNFPSTLDSVSACHSRRARSVLSPMPSYARPAANLFYRSPSRPASCYGVPSQQEALRLKAAQQRFTTTNWLGNGIKHVPRSVLFIGMTILSCTLSLTAHLAHAGEPEATHMLEGQHAGASLTNRLQELATDHPLSPEKIGLYLGPAIEREYQNEISTVISFEFEPSKGISAIFAKNKNNSERNFSVSVLSQGVCITKDDVIKTFGSSFKQLTGVFVEPWPQEKDISEAVKRNMKIFNFGPIYKVSNEDYVNTVTFSFIFSRCSYSITMNERNK